jgi:hypothetical protein
MFPFQSHVLLISIKICELCKLFQEFYNNPLAGKFYFSIKLIVRIETMEVLKQTAHKRIKERNNNL